MARARIITRSHTCSRELALDLLSRGYTVEIVSPDAIPDDFADLELRVEEDPGNQLVATVEAHNDGRTASLEFLHYLKAPMPDFVRRPVESGESATLVKAPDTSIAALSVESNELPVEGSQVAAQTAIAPPESAMDVEEQTGVISLSETHLLPEGPGVLPIEEPAITVPRADTAADEGLRQTEVPRPDSARWRGRFPGRFWRMALISSSVITLAVFIAFGARRNGQASAPGNAADLHEQTATVPEQVSVVNAADSTKVPEIEIPHSEISQQREYAPTFHSKRRGVGAHLARHHHGQRSHRGQVIAANKVTYLDKPAATSAK